MRSNDWDATSHEGVTGGAMSQPLAALLRRRVAARYYDEPQVTDAMARAILRARDETSA
jgi:hypothetical protein